MNTLEGEEQSADRSISGIESLGLFWRLFRFRPWLFSINCAAITALFLIGMVPGLAARSFFDGLQAGRGLGMLWWLAALIVGAALGHVVCMFGLALTNAPFQFTNSALMQRNMLLRILRLPATVALPGSSGEAISRFRDDADEITLTMIIGNNLIASIVFATVALVVMLRVDVVVTVAVFLPLGVIVIAVTLASRRIEHYRRASREATGEVTGFLADVFAAVQAVQLANAEYRVANHLRDLNHVRLRSTVRDRLFDQLLQSLFANTVSLGTGVILLLAGRAMASGSFSVGDFALFVYYLGWFTDFVASLGLSITRFKQARVSFARMRTVMSESSTAEVVRHAPVHLRGPLPRVAAPRRQAPPLSTLTVSGLTCRHASGRGVGPVSFDVKAGSLTAITGRIGSGKTTLLEALLGLRPAEAGLVRWNGAVVDDPASFFVPPQSAYTPQVPRLFSDSLRDNLLLGHDPGEESLKRAVELAALEHDVGEMREGLDTRVGARGVRLSGGQVQRAAAARMFIRGADLIVFDDLSSALDVDTERELWRRVFARPGATVLAVSHRPAVLERADQVLVLDHGLLVASGRVGELLQSSEEMRLLWTGRDDPGHASHA